MVTIDAASIAVEEKQGVGISQPPVCESGRCQADIALRLIQNLPTSPLEMLLSG